MCLSKYSNLEHLREVAKNLYSFEDHAIIIGLSERELAALINTFYQGQEFEVSTTRGEKSKSENGSSDNKKFRIHNKDFSDLELLPNEVYEIILIYVEGEDIKNLRITSKSLYEKTTLMAPLFKEWHFPSSREGMPPGFVLETDKNFKVHDLNSFSSVYIFEHRISSLQIQKEGRLLEFLNMNLYSSKLKHLTSLDLEKVTLDDRCLLILAPQLVNLRLQRVKCYGNTRFHISDVNEDSKCFTKLKTLKLWKIDIDVKKILTQCFNSLEWFELYTLSSSDCLEDLQKEFPSLSSLIIYINEEGCEQSVRNFLSKCSGSLRTLELIHIGDFELDFSILLDQTLVITQLEIQSQGYNIERFLSRCPLVQNLSIHDYKKEINNVFFKDLVNLRLLECGSKCLSSLLKAHKSSIKILYLYLDSYSDLMECDFPEIQKLDTVWIKSDQAYFLLKSHEVDQFLKLFPRNAKVSTEELLRKSHGFQDNQKIVIRRVYDLSSTFRENNIKYMYLK